MEGTPGRPFSVHAPLGSVLSSARAAAVRAGEARLRQLTADNSAEAASLEARAAALRSVIEFHSTARSSDAAAEGEEAEDPLRFEQEELADLEAAIGRAVALAGALRRAEVPLRRLKQQALAWRASLDEGGETGSELPTDATSLLETGHEAAALAAATHTDGGAARSEGSGQASLGAALEAVREARLRWAACWRGVGLVPGVAPSDAAISGGSPSSAADGGEAAAPAPAPKKGAKGSAAAPAPPSAETAPPKPALSADGLPLPERPPSPPSDVVDATAPSTDEDEAVTALRQAEDALVTGDFTAAAASARRVIAWLATRAAQLDGPASACLSPGATYTLVLTSALPGALEATRALSGGEAEEWVPRPPRRNTTSRAASRGQSRAGLQSRASVRRPGTSGATDSTSALSKVQPVGMLFRGGHRPCPLLFRLSAPARAADVAPARQRRTAAALASGIA